AKLDLQPLIERWRSGEKSPTSLERPFAVRADLATMTAASGIEWRGVKAELSGDGDRLQRANATGTLAGGGATRITVEPIASGRKLQFTSGDAGRVFQTLGLISKARGGRLSLAAVTDDRGPETKSTGTLEVSDLRVMEAPLLARILSVGSFEGIGEMFRGDGMTFRRARVPFQWTAKQIRLTDARAIGAIGITGEGTIAMPNGELDLRGEVIPAYTLNSALGKVPFLGELISGKGGGIFGISYRVRGTRKEPDVSVNPLSALAPSKLKEMFLTPFGM
ncbi:MAG: AsmA-like C-terminal domain-containing protein, partial [Candidatus Binatia bacterium]